VFRICFGVVLIVKKKKNCTWLKKHSLFLDKKICFAHNSKSKGNIKKHYRVDPPLFGLINLNKLRLL